MACAVPKRTPVCERERKRERERERKERKREKKSERADMADKEKNQFFVCVFFERVFLFSSVSLSRTLSLPLCAKNRHCKRVEKKKKKKRSTKTFSSKFLSAALEIYDSNAKNRFRMAPRRLDRRSERVFHFQRTVERISRRARKEEYEEQNHQQQEQQREEQQQQRVVVVVVVVIVVVVIVVDW